jgi:hypothetical protein
MEVPLAAVLFLAVVAAATAAYMFWPTSTLRWKVNGIGLPTGAGTGTVTAEKVGAKAGVEFYQVTKAYPTAGVLDEYLGLAARVSADLLSPYLGAAQLGSLFIIFDAPPLGKKTPSEDLHAFADFVSTTLSELRTISHSIGESWAENAGTSPALRALDKDMTAYTRSPYAQGLWSRISGVMWVSPDQGSMLRVGFSADDEHPSLVRLAQWAIELANDLKKRTVLTYPFDRGTGESRTDQELTALLVKSMARERRMVSWPGTGRSIASAEIGHRV